MNNPRKGSSQQAPYRGDEQQQAPSADARKSPMKRQYLGDPRHRGQAEKQAVKKSAGRTLLADALQTE